MNLMNSWFNPAIRLMNNLKYPQKILFLGAIVLSIMILLSSILYQQLNRVVVKTTKQLEGIEQIVAVNELIRLTQQLRGLSSIKTNDDVQFMEQYRKKEQQANIDYYNLINALDPDMSLMTGVHNTGVRNISYVCDLCNKDDLNNLADITPLWEQIKKNRSSRTIEKNFSEYSYLIRQLQLLIFTMGDHYLLITDEDISSYYLINIFLHNIPDATESMGKIRAIVSQILINKDLLEKRTKNLIALESLLERSVHHFSYNLTKIAYNSPELIERTDLIALKLIKAKNKVSNQLNNEIYKGKIDIIPNEFWVEITENIDSLYHLMRQEIVPNLKMHFDKRINKISSILNAVIVISTLLLLLTLYLMVALYKALLGNIMRISETINKFSQGDLEARIKLDTKDEMRDISLYINDMANKLSEYQQQLVFIKQALDEHAIVSITDVKGNITYANSKFEKISQYSHEELMGKNHRILKSDEHPDSLFKEMWKTIANGKVWHGDVKNKAKDGSFYWVSATIVPYMNKQGKPEQYISIRTDISHIKAMEEKQKEVNRLLFSEKALTEQARRKAEEANQAKSEFLSSMSHELRTPMNAILGFAQILEYDDRLNDEQKDSVQEILTGGNHLLELINEVLDLARIESGHLNLSPESVKLLPLVNECFNLIAPLARKRGISIHSVGINDYFVHADRTRLKQVLLNLLSNAIKYNSEQGSVELDVYPVNNNIRITITDTGNGIEKNRLNELFQPFNRLQIEACEIEGTGIGLTITRKLVKLMDGNIGVDSQQNIGSCFWIELPIKQR